jgi:hypothetical protein
MKFLDNIFGKSKPDRRDMDQLIFDLAEHGNRPADLKELYRRMAGIEVFAKLLSANFPLQNGARHTIEPGQKMQILAATLPTGQVMAQFFVDRADARLRPQFVSLSSREACEMVLKMENLAGLIICNSKNSWIALLKPELQRLLKHELSKP